MALACVIWLGGFVPTLAWAMWVADAWKIHDPVSGISWTRRMGGAAMMAAIWPVWLPYLAVVYIADKLGWR